jgi:acyl-CoA synthetase (AMP-forming)/AMP-acid ligase II
MGRDKDLIVRGGSNISPPEVEETLRAHPQVADVAVAGVADDELGQRVGALLVVANTDAANTDPDNPAIDEIMAWASQRLAHYKLPERIRVVQAIPRNDLTKIDRAAAGKALMSTETRQVNLRRLEEREVLGQTDSTDDWGGNGT